MGGALPYYVYILTNFKNSVLYTGVTNNLIRRVSEHREKSSEGFTKQYHVWKLVYYEVGDEVLPAMEREKQIKAGPRRKKIDLIQGMNPDWKDLYWQIGGD